MNYIPNTEKDRRQMLDAIGASSIDSLFKDIPEKSSEKDLPSIPRALSEIDLLKDMGSLSEKNLTLDQKISFLGAGAYNHFIPSVVKHIISRSEFYTAYTPYQPEMSQGILQAIYEYQTMICRLTGMDAANASHYDGATALTEAAFMACNHTGRKKVLISSAVHPEHRKVLNTYAAGADIKVSEIGFKGGVTDNERLNTIIDKDTACVILQNPNFFGSIEDAEAAAGLAHENGALFISSVDPVSLGILEAPSKYGADIVVAEGQGMGNQLNFGGPYLGIMAVRTQLLRLLPGRIIGRTSDNRGNKGFVLTLQTREQHIRREKATSNICSNEALCALASAVYLASVGKEGLKKVGRLCIDRSQYAKRLLSGLKGFSIPFSAATFKEFVVKLPVSSAEINKELSRNGIIGGFDLGRYYSEFKDHMLFCFTEVTSKDDIDKLLSVLKNVSGK